VKFGLTLSNRGVALGLNTPADLLTMACRAEESGLFDSVWAGDSLFAQPRLDAVTLLAAIAARTSHVKLGPACMGSFPLRNPLVLAYEWASLDQLSGGRAIMVACSGGRAGSMAGEYRAMGIPAEERFQRLLEHVSILRRLWTEDRVSHNGRFFQFEDVTLKPKPVQQPAPIWLASNPSGMSPENLDRALRRVAQMADGWMTHSIPPAEFARRWETIVGYARVAGRDPVAMGNCLYHNITVGRDRESAFEETKGFLDLYYNADYGRGQIEAWSTFGTPGECVELLRRWEGSGIQRITLRLCSRDEQGQLERLISDVLPRLA